MLGMYDMSALQPVNDRYWNLIRENLGEGPDRLTRDRDFWEIWKDPGLIFAQTCGMPFRTRLYGQVQLVGTPDYGLPDCPPGHYYSVFVARIDDTRGLNDLATGCFAYNEALSQSGWAAPMTHMTNLGLTPAELRETGGHARSARAVADGSADFAALDALTWVMLKEHSDLSDHLREVEVTEPSPTLPYITAMGRDTDHVARAVRRAITSLSEQDRQALHIRGLVDIPAELYLSIATPPPPEANAPSS